MNLYTVNKAKKTVPGSFLIIIDSNGSNPILKISFMARKLLSKVVYLSRFASPNEKSKSVGEFKNSLKDFEIILYRGTGILIVARK